MDVFVKRNEKLVIIILLRAVFNINLLDINKTNILINYRILLKNFGKMI
jgi:hypothetical protein